MTHNREARLHLTYFHAHGAQLPRIPIHAACSSTRVTTAHA